MNKKILFLILFVAAIFLPFATKAATLTGMTQSIQTTAMAIGSTLVVVGWVIAGILYLTAAGSPEKTSLAKKAMIAAVIGTALILIAEGGEAMIKGLIPGLFS